MKRNTKYHILRFPGIAALLSVLVLASCVKARVGRTDFSSLQPVVLIPEGGLHAFSSEALVFPGSDDTDTATFHLNYASSNVAAADETITIGIDPAALATYNSTSTAQFEIFPDSIFSFTTTTVTVKKGNNYSDAISLAVFPSKVDPTKNYMLPISIKKAPAGSTISTDFGTIFYHFIGNPIAGSYSDEWIRYNTAGQTGSPAFDQTSGSTFSPVDNTTVSTDPDGTGFQYLINFTNTAGVLSNFNVSFVAGTTAGITITGGPTIVLADPIAGKYTFNFTYLNGSGAPRNITDKFVKQ
jgi:hypothetical protein